MDEVKRPGLPDPAAAPGETGALDETALAAILRAAGLSMTLPRRSVFNYLRANHVHPTAAQVADAIPGISMATVYNTLTRFQALGVVKAVRAPDGEVRWDVRTDEHHHLTCSRCGAVEDISPDRAAVVVRDPALAAQVDQTELWFTGRCSTCHS